MKRNPKAVGIYNNEIYIANFNEDGVIEGFDTLRPVESSMLEELRDASTYKEYCVDLWKDAVQTGSTELGLEDFAQELIDEADVDNDEEAFPCKDESGLEYLTAKEREQADKFLLESKGIEVGTWECSGWCHPNFEIYKGDGKWQSIKKFDYVFDKALSKQYFDMIKK